MNFVDPKQCTGLYNTLTKSLSKIEIVDFSIRVTAEFAASVNVYKFSVARVYNSIYAIHIICICVNM
jgi:hypothetical protein